MRQVIALANGKKIRVTWWQVALLAIAVSGISRLIASKSSKKSQLFYSEKMKQAPWAPPGWLFGPAWAFNNFFIIWAILRITQMKKSQLKIRLIVMQAFIWFIFYSFDYVYFNKKSPILAAIWTKTDSLLSLISLILAYKEDSKIAACYIPLTIWTCYASSVADYQMLHNRDPLFDTKPLLDYIR